MEMNWKRLFYQKKIQGIIFDFDGIIGDTERLQKEKWDIILEPYGIKISLEEYAKNYCGKTSSQEIPAMLKKKYGKQITLTAEQLGEQAAITLKKLYETREIKRMPDAKKAILFFLGFPMVVCSSRDPEQLEMKLSSVGLSKTFPPKYRATQSEAGGLGKPHPAMYLLAVRKLNLSPYQCVAFEDTATGIASASKAGIFTIAMPTEYSKGQDFSEADVMVEGGWPAFLKECELSFSKFKGS